MFQQKPKTLSGGHNGWPDFKQNIYIWLKPRKEYFSQI